MKVATMTASSLGVLTVGTGLQVAAVPLRGTPLTVLTLELNGDPGNTLELEPGRVLRPGPWVSARLTGAQVGSVWRVLKAETAAESIGELPLQPVVLVDVEMLGEVANGTYYLTNPYAQNGGAAATGTFSQATEEGPLIDVRGFSSVKFAVRSDNGLADYVGTMHVKVYLEGYDEAAMRKMREMEVGTSNEFGAAAGLYGCVEVGAATDSEAALERHVATRFDYVRPRVVVSGGPINWDGGLLLKLVGYP
jgi:hypothetical protein